MFALDKECAKSVLLFSLKREQKHNIWWVFFVFFLGQMRPPIKVRCHIIFFIGETDTKAVSSATTPNSRIAVNAAGAGGGGKTSGNLPN